MCFCLIYYQGIPSNKFICVFVIRKEISRKALTSKWQITNRDRSPYITDSQKHLDPRSKPPVLRQISYLIYIREILPDPFCPVPIGPKPRRASSAWAAFLHTSWTCIYHIISGLAINSRLYQCMESIQKNESPPQCPSDSIQNICYSHRNGIANGYPWTNYFAHEVQQHG